MVPKRVQKVSRPAAGIYIKAINVNRFLIALESNVLCSAAPPSTSNNQNTSKLFMINADPKILENHRYCFVKEL